MPRDTVPGEEAWGCSPGQEAMREVRAMTILEQAHKRRLWEAEFDKYVRDYFHPWQRSLLLHMRFRRISGDWPMRDLPDGSEC